MKKRILIIGAILLLLIGGGIWVICNKGETTVEAAIVKAGRTGKVIYQENVNDGVVVFIKRLTGNTTTYDASYIKKSLLGWKWVWGGEFSGYSGQYFQQVSGTPFPMLFGDINNEKIAGVKLTDSEHKNSINSKIVGNNDDRIWFAFVKTSDGPVFKINELSSLGKVLDSKSIDIRTSTTF